MRHEDGREHIQTVADGYGSILLPAPFADDQPDTLPVARVRGLRIRARAAGIRRHVTAPNVAFAAFVVGIVWLGLKI